MKFILNYYSCNRAARKKCGEIVGCGHEREFDSKSQLTDKLTEIEADQVSEVSGVKIHTRLDEGELRYGFRVFLTDGSSYQYNYNDLDSTRKEWKLAKKRKTTREISPFWVFVQESR